MAGSIIWEEKKKLKLAQIKLKSITTNLHFLAL